MTVKPRGKAFYASFMVKGVRYRATFSTYDGATRWEEDVRHALRTGRPVPSPNPQKHYFPDGSGTVSTVGKLYRYSMQHHFSKLPRSYKTAMMNGQSIVNFFGEDHLITEINRKAVDDFVSHLDHEVGNSPATINRKLAALSKMLKIAKDLDELDKLPRIPRFKETARKTRFVDPVEEKQLIDTLISYDDQELADLVAFAIDTGARQSEIFKSPWDWFNREGTRWTIWLNKADHDRTQPLAAMRRAIIKRRRALGLSGPFYRMNPASVKYRLERAMGHLDINDVTFHTFRHTCASRLVQRGVDLRRVQTWMGHKAIATTIRYAQLAPRDLDDALVALEA